MVNRYTGDPRFLAMLSFLICLHTGIPALAQEDPLACAPAGEKYQTRVDKKGTIPKAASPGKALVYVMMPMQRFLFARFVSRSSLALKGKTVGVNVPGTVIHVEADPGVLRFCSRPDVGGKAAAQYIFLSVEAGRRYFIRNDLRLTELPESEGEKLLAKCKPVQFRIKN